MDPLTLAAIAIVALAVIVAAIMLRRSWGGSLSNTPRPPSGAQPSVPSAGIADTDLAEVSALLARGNKIEAIKRVRQLTGLGLKEAKDYVEAMAAGPIHDLPVPVHSAGGDDNDSGQTLADVSALLARGNKIEAIKRVRQLTGLGLKEAKDYVEAMEAGGDPPALPGAIPARPASTGSLAEVHALALQGRKIEAIKLYRELTGVGLKQAKDYVDRL